MPRDRMENNGFEGGEAVLLAARCIPPENNQGGQRGGRRDTPVVVEMGMGDAPRRGGGAAPPPVTHTNGGPPCHCPSEDTHDGAMREKSPSPPMPLVTQQSPWHRHKSIYLTVIMITLVVWIIVYTIISQMDLA